ncbi:MAG TPA: benzoyl-CoA 2,3-epoxidase subunit BoxA [Roseiarcus sp.]|nr:benzoyl-CoA 2,3-epoxidase subunit BoxA [Roseiarcus sp.]
MKVDQAFIKQHVIDPKVCIRCNTCEETCPVGAVTHDSANYVVDAEKCNYCMDCISPCPTGSIDNWRIVAEPYSLDEQFSWRELPPQEAVPKAGGEGSIEAFENEVDEIIARAHSGVGGKSVAPPSASKPSVNLFSRARPAVATVVGTYRLTDPAADNDVKHIILNFGETPFPVLEGQSVGVAAPGADENGEPHRLRLYSIASPRHGEKPNTNSIALTVKREGRGLCSNYLCDLKKGDRVSITGPFGATFLMPDDPSAHIIMICTGTGSAPFRGFTEHRRRMTPDAPGRLALFFGARRPEELPYFGPLQSVPEKFLAKRFAYSRLPGAPKTYVQDVMRGEQELIAELIAQPNTHIYICGLKGMEQGVEAALDEVCRRAAIDWAILRASMRQNGRYHVETY